ncbi:SCO family protein [Fontivita pretiosa]|uniref:SCO family protein n=1 Tax=Fontivita pretiosa TaxID=2989684 RepID=UPI003D180E67
MDRTQKTLLTALWALAVLAMIGVVATGMLARRHAAGVAEDPHLLAATARLEPLYDAPAFSLTDQHGRTVSDQTLRGKVWVAMVFFTECPGVCPMMVSRMTGLQKAVPSPEINIVSFSIDPRHDTPETMKSYADRMGADQSRWYFLTGPEPTMFQVARGLKLAAAPATADQPITHTQKVLLIDRQNRIRGIYDSADDLSMQELAQDARTLLAEKPADKEPAP